MKQKSDKKILKVKIPKGWIPMSFKCDLVVKNGEMIMEVELFKREFAESLKRIMKLIRIMKLMKK